MGRWFQEEVAGDRYIFDSELNPVVLGCPQGVPVFVIVGEQDRAAQRACEAHNADIDALAAEVDEWKEKERITSELFEAACNDLGDAQEELAAAIEYANSRDAEVDELQRRLDAVVKMLEPKKPMPQHEDFHPFDIDQWNDAVCEWQRKIDIHARAVAIAEGRTE